MRFRSATLFALLMLAATPTHAERLLFDHRIEPHICTVLDSGRKEMVLYADNNPKYDHELIALHSSPRSPRTRPRSPSGAKPRLAPGRRQRPGSTASSPAASRCTCSARATRER